MAESYVPQDLLHLWWLRNPAQPKRIGELNLVHGGRAVGLRYAAEWVRDGFSLSEDLTLAEQLFIPEDRDCAVGAGLHAAQNTAGVSG